MRDFQKIFKKVNGKKVLKEYAQSHVLLHALAVTALEGTSRKSLEIVRESVSNKIVKRLRKQYKSFITDFKKSYAKRIELKHEHSNKVWVCWLQGIEAAPDIVKKCYQSLLDNLDEKEIILLTNENYKKWVNFPAHVQEKIDNGTISNTHMTDFLRLELLEHYGGTWIDATVLCTGNNIPSYIWDSDFFIYQIMKPGLDAHPQRTSSWFITAYTNHPIIMLTKELLYEYWRTNRRMVDYFLIHDFMELAIEAYPEEWIKVVPVSSSIPHILLLRLEEQYDDIVWQATKEMTPFHKLTWKFSDSQYLRMKRPKTYYSEIIERV